MDNFFNLLNDVAQSFFRNHPITDIGQILVTMRSDGTIENYYNNLSEQSENDFLMRQTEPLRALLCVWNNNALDIPSYRIRTGLIAKFPVNKDCVIYLRGQDGPLPKMLSATIVKLTNIRKKESAVL